MRQVFGLGLIFAFLTAITAWVEELTAAAFPGWQYALSAISLVVTILLLIICGIYFSRLLREARLAVLAGVWAGAAGGFMGAVPPVLLGHGSPITAMVNGLQAALATAIYGGILALIGSSIVRMSRARKRSS